MLIVDAATVRALFTPARALDTMRLAFANLGSDCVTQPPRLVAELENDRTLAVMPAGVSGECLGVKLVTIVPANREAGRSPHSATLVMFDPVDGTLSAIIDGVEVTAVRTAAASALATDLLARPSSSSLAILGSGVQAHAHLRSIIGVRPVTSVRIWSRRQEQAQKFAAEAIAEFSVEALTFASPGDAVATADIVCTTTASSVPIVTSDMLRPGMHINAIGASFAVGRELSGDAVAVCRVFVDSRHAARCEAGDLILAEAEGHFAMDAICAELGELVLGLSVGRASDADITLFKSVGVAVQDIFSGTVIEGLVRGAKGTGRCPDRAFCG